MKWVFTEAKSLAKHRGRLIRDTHTEQKMQRQTALIHASMPKRCAVRVPRRVAQSSSLRDEDRLLYAACVKHAGVPGSTSFDVRASAKMQDDTLRNSLSRLIEQGWMRVYGDPRNEKGALLVTRKQRSFAIGWHTGIVLCGWMDHHTDTLVDAELFSTSSLSAKARGLLIRILSYPEAHMVSNKMLAKTGRCRTREMRQALIELHAGGYLRRNTQGTIVTTQYPRGSGVTA